MASYFTYWLIVKVLITYFGVKTIPITFIQSLNVKDTRFSLREIALTTFISVILGIILTSIANYKLHFRLMHKLKVTKKFGEQDVWGYTFNSDQINWVTVRDIKNNLIYDGWFQAFSDNSIDAELFLRDVSIYKNDTGEQLYQVGALYVARNRSDMTIEFRDIPISDNIQWKEVGT